MNPMIHHLFRRIGDDRSPSSQAVKIAWLKPSPGEGFRDPKVGTHCKTVPTFRQSPTQGPIPKPYENRHTKGIRRLSAIDHGSTEPKGRRHLKNVDTLASDFDFGRDRTDVMNEVKPRYANRQSGSALNRQGPSVCRSDSCSGYWQLAGHRLREQLVNHTTFHIG